MFTFILQVIFEVNTAIVVCRQQDAALEQRLAKVEVRELSVVRTDPLR